MMVCTLPTEEQALMFMRASEDIELHIDYTVVQMYNFADYKVGEPPPFTPKKNINKEWDLIGVIIGPYAEQVSDSDKEAYETQWAKQIVEILEEYGLVHEEDIIH